MKGPWLYLTGLAGIVSGVLWLAFGDGRDDQDRRRVAGLGPAPTAGGSLAGEVARPDEELQAPRVVAPRESSATREESRPSPEISEASSPTASSAPPEIGLDEFQAFVNETLREVRREVADEERKKIERRRTALEDLFPRLEQGLSLEGEEAAELRDILHSELDRESEYVLLKENGAEESEIDVLRKEDTRARHERLRAFLTEPQVRAVLRAAR